MGDDFAVFIIFFFFKENNRFIILRSVSELLLQETEIESEWSSKNIHLMFI